MLFAAAVLALAGVVSANHNIKLVNNCSYGVPLFIDSWPGSVKYTGPYSSPGTLGAHVTQTVSVPNGWNSRICHNADNAKCWGSNSMTEFNFDAGGLVYYDISNILGYSIPQRISGACQTVTCTSANCPCDQAYPKGNTAGCGPVVDAPVRACGNQDLTVTFCP